MRIVMSIKEWEILMKHINKNELGVISSLEIGDTDENILGVNHLAYLSDDRLYGYSLKERAEKFYTVDEISDEKISFDVKAEDLIELLEGDV